jgi:SET family sugar efflux transporter-like MFS transporter
VTPIPSLAIFSRGTRELFFINVLTAIAYSFVLPIMSMFLVQHLKTDPIYIGFFTVTTAIASIWVNQRVGKLMDAGISAKNLFLIALSSLIITGLFFANLTEFWQAVVVGLVFFSTGNASIPILLVIIRRHADQSGLHSTRLNAQMRSGVSLVWIVGPAFSFTLIEQIGFSATYYAAAFLALMAGLLALWLMPNTHKIVPKMAQSTQAVHNVPLKFWLLGAVIVLGNFCNGLYIISMPLFVKLEMGLAESSVGLLMGVTAAIEIPAMLLSPRWSERYGRGRVFTLAFAVAIVFYGLLQWTNTFFLLAIAQLLNGLFFGIFVGLGISIMQDQLPERTGYASSFHTNGMRLGSMLGSSAAGFLAQFFGYQASLLGSFTAAIAAFILLTLLSRHSSNSVSFN